MYSLLYIIFQYTDNIKLYLSNYIYILVNNYVKRNLSTRYMDRDRVNTKWQAQIP